MPVARFDRGRSVQRGYRPGRENHPHLGQEEDAEVIVRDFSLIRHDKVRRDQTGGALESTLPSIDSPDDRAMPNLRVRASSQIAFANRAKVKPALPHGNRTLFLKAGVSGDSDFRLEGGTATVGRPKVGGDAIGTDGGGNLATGSRGHCLQDRTGLVRRAGLTLELEN